MTRTYVVSGAGSGIGKATKELLESRGERVISIARRDADVNVDLADPAQRATIADRVAELSGGTIDAVIAVAGIAQPVIEGVQVNYMAARDLVVDLRPLLLSSPAPRAVIVTSISVVHPASRDLVDALLAGDDEASIALAQSMIDEGQPFFLYTSAKRAIAEWVRINAVTDEWAGAGIVLNTMAPATVITKMNAEVLSTEEGRAMVAQTTPMPLNGHAQPIVAANLLAWLTSAENTHVTGQSIFMDGGSEAVLRGPQVFEGLSLSDFA